MKLVHDKSMNPIENRGVNSGIDMTPLLMTRMTEYNPIGFKVARCLITQPILMSD